MNTNKQSFKPSRRLFLQRVTVGGGTAGLLLGTGLSLSAEAETQLDSAPGEKAETRSSGYHLSEHIREYYRKAAF